MSCHVTRDKYGRAVSFICGDPDYESETEALAREVEKWRMSAWRYRGLYALDGGARTVKTSGVVLRINTKEPRRD